MLRNTIILTATLLCMTSSAYSDDPTSIPWPVGDDLPEMYQTKTLMNSYGDPNGSWADRKFHCGIDIDSHTSSPNCTDVRCVHGEEGVEDVVISRMFEEFFDGYLQWTVVTTPGDSLIHEEYGWCYEHLSDPRIQGWEEWMAIEEGEYIAPMHPYVATPHIHFKWTAWDFDPWCYVTPLD